MNLPAGFQRNLSFADYQKIPATNYSTLKRMDRSPLSYKYFRDNPQEPTPRQKMGNLAHTAILEPSLSNFAVWTGGTRNSNAYKDWCVANEGKQLINEKERDQLEGIASAVNANPLAAKYLRHATPELTMLWRDPSLKRYMKGRIDALNEIVGETVMISLKTTVNCGNGRLGFGYQYANMGYAAQDALYQSGHYYLTGTLPRVVVIAVDQDAPYEVAIYHVPETILRIGQQKIQEWGMLLNECEKKNEWPGAVVGEAELTLPNWAYPQGDFDYEDLEVIG